MCSRDTGGDGRRPEAGRRFIGAYLQGVRDYNDALKDGRIAGPKRT
jgi:hypothetical protein